MTTLLTIDNTLLALIAGICTWATTLLGASVVFLLSNFSKRTTAAMYGFSSGIMIAASITSLLLPAINMLKPSHLAFLPATLGFIIGCSIFLIPWNKIYKSFLCKLNRPIKDLTIEPLPQTTPANNNTLRSLIWAITLHNIPEGLALGITFGAIVNGNTLAAAISFCMAIAIQNFPEGAAVSVPLASSGISKIKSFFIAQATAIVEPIFALLGAILITSVTTILPYALGFAAGAMLTVSLQELISQFIKTHHQRIGIIGSCIGFMLMIALDSI
ncbi:MAG: ZIP family metal transporter [Clostridiales bacterium]|nr:ZIP family metal transporter [Clostridiales bacterium]